MKNFEKVKAAVSGVINVNARLAGVSAPVNSNDAATKAYVDATSPLPGYLCPSQIESSDRPAQTLANAITTCRNLGNNWRLPTAEELTCFAGQYGPNNLWTRTPLVGYSPGYWLVLGGVLQYAVNTSTPIAFRCVR